MHERQDPGARLRPLGPEAGRRAPDADERLLDRVLGEAVVAQDAEGEPVGDPADAVVELCQRRLVAARDERDESLVREMSEVLPHRPTLRWSGNATTAKARNASRRDSPAATGRRFGSGAEQRSSDRTDVAGSREQAATALQRKEQQMRRTAAFLGLAAVCRSRRASPRCSPATGRRRASASSHSEAPLISQDPRADNTDLYAFVSPDDTNTVTFVANYIPLEAPASGPNFPSFDDNVLYEIKIDNTGDGADDIGYQFRFTTQTRNPDTFLYNTGPITSLSDPNWNRPQTYSVTRVHFKKNGKIEQGGKTSRSCSPTTSRRRPTTSGRARRRTTTRSRRPP